MQRNKINSYEKYVLIIILRKSLACGAGALCSWHACWLQSINLILMHWVEYHPLSGIHTNSMGAAPE